jgi:hypothetical protein
VQLKKKRKREEVANPEVTTKSSKKKAKAMDGAKLGRAGEETEDAGSKRAKKAHKKGKADVSTSGQDGQALDETSKRKSSKKAVRAKDGGGAAGVEPGTSGVKAEEAPPVVTAPKVATHIARFQKRRVGKMVHGYSGNDLAAILGVSAAIAGASMRPTSDDEVRKSAPLRSTVVSRTFCVPPSLCLDVLMCIRLWGSGERD